MTPMPTQTRCPACGDTKRHRQYLCRRCWFALTESARTALSRRDGRAFARLQELHDQIGAGRAPHLIGISP